MSDIVERLRDGEPGSMWDGAREILRLRAENEKLRAATTPICVGRRIIGILAKEGAWTSETGASVVAADELFCNDPYEVIEKLRAALKRWEDTGLQKDWPITYDGCEAAELKETGDE